MSDWIMIGGFLGVAVAQFWSNLQWQGEVRELERRIDILCERLNSADVPPYEGDEAGK